MIRSLKLGPEKKGGRYGWAFKTDFFKRNGTVSFTDGLNVLFGPSGSGKSTVIGLLASHLAAEQGGRSVVTQDWLGGLTDFASSEPAVNSIVEHDGQPILYVSPRKTIGLRGGTFDDDFIREGLANSMARGSSK